MGTSEDSAAAAALAFKHICDDCRKKLCGYLDGLYNVYRTAVNGEGSLKVSAEDSLHLVEALRYGDHLYSPSCLGYANNGVCLPSMQYAVRTSKRFMGITIGAMLEEIQALYQQHQQPCFLYLSSEVIKIFGSDPSCASYLHNLIEALFKRTVCLLTSIEEFTSRLDVADDCFLLASRCIRYCPQLFIPSSIFPSLVDCAMIGITVQHREASNSILTFLFDIFDLSKSIKREEFISMRDSVIIPRGARITKILIASLTRALPSSRLETVTYALLSLTRAYRVQALEWAKESVSMIPLTVVAEVERSRFLQAMSDAASGADVNALMVPVEELSDVCSHN
ncbi:hypothetical protein LWI29_027974 [Acer saccharum]|uniref:Uncharacterized protein n=1 Tax=Acer saccharum TaxID=4024 RepID=A0AA39VRN2_ACESA|nr:hypothetical protein LWI29_027974 [Acer saccharum]